MLLAVNQPGKMVQFSRFCFTQMPMQFQNYIYHSLFSSLGFTMHSPRKLNAPHFIFFKFFVARKSRIRMFHQYWIFYWQVACSTDSFMGYGPVTPKGYGCSYNPHPDEIVFCVSSFYSADNTSASRYAKSLQDSLDMMRKLLGS